MNDYEALSAALSGIAGWVEDEVAAGEPERVVVQQAVEGVRHIAWLARQAGNGSIAPDGIAAYLAGDTGGGDTLLLRSRTTAQPRVRRWRGWRPWQRGRHQP